MTKWQEITRNDCLRILASRENGLKEMRQTELVVIGGTGFIGTWLAEMVATLNDEYQFDITLHLVARGVEQFSDRCPHLAGRDDVHLIKSDVRHLVQFPTSADWVIHAASDPDVRVHASNPLDTASIITEGTMSVVKTTERMGRLQKMLYLSSGLVCGAQADSERRIAEGEKGAPPPDASFVYPNAKRFAETICSAARMQSRVPVLVARPFSFIGPYQSLSTPWAQTTFLLDALHGHNIRVLGDGQVVRSYLYGADAAYWYLRILVAGQGGDVVNVGSPVGITLQDLAKEIAGNFEPSPEIMLNTSPRSAGRPAHLLPDTRHAENEFGLSVYTPLKDAIHSTVQWHLAQMIK